MQYYKEQVLSDIEDWANDNKDTIEGKTLEDVRDILRDPCMSDSITGNGTGSYYCNTAMAEEQINRTGILFDQDFLGYLEDLDVSVGDILNKGAEIVDVWARCACIDLLSDYEIAQACGIEC